MQIINLGLQFIPSRLSTGNIPKFIGLHHSGGVGTIYKGRPIEFIPAGISNHNQNSLYQVTPNPTPSLILNKVFKLQNILNLMGITDRVNNKLSADGIAGVKTLTKLAS